MRKHQQQQILELLKTIEEAQAAGLYADCQQGALTVGEYIEEIEGEGTRTVALLEDYCELLYKVSNGELGEKNLRKQLIKIETSVKNELKQTRIEMVFLSYKASMSDSLESIYLAAKQDTDCDAYWIPIPYIDRGADNYDDAFHIEGAEYYADAGIECTDWQEYDIEARHPDVIFTFAPYDEYNYVTSVHPFFYCKRLRELTDCLVYVPYFVWGEGAIPEQFCVMPGCMFAHRVIVQSEEIRGKYLEVYKRRHGSKYGVPEEKFLALGSPKFDKVIYSKREDFELPEEWAAVIVGKKAVLYNTSVSAILNGNEYYLVKLRSVLDAFKGRGDVALWWRPHPLSESTYMSMRPHLYPEYKKLVDEYKSEGWGIYDDSPDLHRSIACTDAYYGDGSSVLTMYHAAGKPGMIQDLDEYFPDFYRISAVTDDAIWCLAHKYNALFRIDRSTYECKCIGAFPGEHLDEPALYIYAAVREDKIYFTPHRADAIAVYDMKSGSFSFIPVRSDVNLLMTQETEFHHGAKFLSAYAYGDYIYFTPSAYPAVMRLNCRTNKVEYIDDFINKLPDDYKKPPHNAVYIFGEPAVNGSKIVIPLRRGNAVLIFDMETCKSEIIRDITDDLPDHAVASLIAYDGCNYWIFYAYVGKLVCWDLSENAPEVIIDTDEELYPGYISYASGYIWVSSPKKSLKIDVKTKEIAVAGKLLCGSGGTNEGFAMKVVGDDSGILRYTTSDGKYCESAVGEQKLTNMLNMSDNLDVAQLRSELLPQATSSILPDRGYIRELPFMQTGDFLDAIAGGALEYKPGEKSPAGRSAGEGKTAGAAIYEAVRGIANFA